MNTNKNIPLVSIITVCYNSDKYIQDTIESVINQTYDNIEYIIIDGKSTDNTLDIIKKYSSKYQFIKYKSEKDRGIYNAMNKGLGITKAEKNDFIFFLNSGDYFIDKNILKKVIKFSKTKNLDFVYGPVEVGKNNILKNKINYKLSLLFKTICHQGIFAKKICFDNNKFNERLKWLSDYEWVINCFYNEKINVGYINEVISYFDPKNNTNYTDYNLKRNRLKERKYIGKKYFNGFKKILFLINNYRLFIKNYIKYKLFNKD